jgi:hypothetical protein
VIGSDFLSVVFSIGWKVLLYISLVLGTAYLLFRLQDYIPHQIFSVPANIFGGMIMGIFGSISHCIETVYEFCMMFYENNCPKITIVEEDE